METGSGQQSWVYSGCLRDYVLLIHVFRSFFLGKCIKDETNQQYELCSIAKTPFLAAIFMY